MSQVSRLPIGTLVSHGGLKGRIVGRCQDQSGEWYRCQIYRSQGKPWKVKREYLVVRR